MENASKALLIAASVLIAILLIAMAVRVLTSTQGTVDSVDGTMKTTEQTLLINKFSSYVGTNKSKAQVMSLINLVQSHNQNSSTKVGIEVTIDSATHKFDPTKNYSKKDGNVVNSINNINNNYDSIINAVGNTTNRTFTIEINTQNGFKINVRAV